MLHQRLSNGVTRFIGTFASVAMLAGCVMQPPIGAPPYATSSRLLPPNASNGYQLLYAFRGNSNSQTDGDSPRSALVAVKNRLYGTTIIGGNQNYSACGRGKFFAGCGTVFEVSTSGQEQVLYPFAGGRYGFFPYAGLVEVNGALYGTTSAGGTCRKYHRSCGLVFSLSLSGEERVLHRFAGPPDGVAPSANLIAVNGTLYGTTSKGGWLHAGCARSHGCGVAFGVSQSGRERVAYAFKSGNDGAYPSGPLFAFHGALYGTTWSGGSGRCGTVFKLSPSGNESVVHSFEYPDGCRPVGGLVAINGVLYGVTAYGGGTSCECGTVFELTTAGSEKQIYEFAGGKDGYAPEARLTAFEGALYGTTPQGGAACNASQGCGTVFKVTTAGIETVLYAFKGGSDGAVPEAGLTAFGGVLYGTTAGGGGQSCGYASSEDCGTVFKISPTSASRARVAPSQNVPAH